MTASEKTPLYDIVPGTAGRQIRVHARGSDVLRTPRLNRGTAFTHEQRAALGLVGLLPEGVHPLGSQLHRLYRQFTRLTGALDKFTFLASVRDRNTVLFYKLLSEHLEEMMPIVYTPTIGEAIQNFSLSYGHRVHAAFLSIDEPDAVEVSLRALGRAPDAVDLVIVTDSEGILGIGDQGVGGVQICLGKKSLYTAAAGVDPNRIVPVVLDVGTDNLGLLSDDFYLGVRHTRVRGKRYDEFVDTFVEAASRVFPHAMVHWEDFGAANAHRILDKYRSRICTFNDDVQGTAAVVGAAALAAVKAKGERMREQRVVVYGAGTAGVGIADLLVDLMVSEGLPRDQARELFWCLGSRGLITTSLGDNVRHFQRPYARQVSDLADWSVVEPGQVTLAEVVAAVRPTILIGTSAQPGSFDEATVRLMAAAVDRPIIMPLSNPTVLSEALPVNLLAWTDGRALIATGSPFEPVVHGDVTYTIAQANNAFVFPGLGLGVAVARANRVTDGMIAAAAQALAATPRASQEGASLLPCVDNLRMVSATVAVAVAKRAAEDGVAECVLTDPIQQVFDMMWQPEYPELIIE